MPTNFKTTHLPKVEKNVYRLGIAGNYGIDSSDIEWAAEQGANYWIWGASYKKVADGISHVLHQDRDKQVVAMLGWGVFGWQIRKHVENALRQLNTDYLDVFKLSWLGKMSSDRQGLIDTLLELKLEGKIRVIGTSIHDRARAGRIALDSEIDLLMVRYNAKHTGAEQEIFPHLEMRNPALIAYTALAWNQLTRPLKGLDTPPLTTELCYRFVLSNPHVHLALTGPANREQLKQNFAALELGPLSPEEMELVREYGRQVKAKKKLDYVK
jgi:aryl-alcohol dehydrogenase-like predicted oxidoreductase